MSTTMSTTITLVVEMTSESDGSYSISVENPQAPGDARFEPGGLSEGMVFDYRDSARVASEIVQEYLTENGWRIDPDCADESAQTPWGEPRVEGKRVG